MQNNKNLVTEQGMGMYSSLTNWDNVFIVFERKYQHILDRMVDWYPSGREEFTVVLDDGSEIIYNYVRDKIGRGYVPNDNPLDKNTDNWLTTFAFRLNCKMKERFMTQTELSELTGLSKVILSRYMNGKAMPSFYNAGLIAKALDCSIHELGRF